LELVKIDSVKWSVEALAEPSNAPERERLHEVWESNNLHQIAIRPERKRKSKIGLVGGKLGIVDEENAHEKRSKSQSK
jgi:hypothetical protein